jgi:hypothetical protein
MRIIVRQNQYYSLKLFRRYVFSNFQAVGHWQKTKSDARPVGSSITSLEKKR